MGEGALTNTDIFLGSTGLGENNSNNNLHFFFKLT